MEIHSQGLTHDIKHSQGLTHDINKQFTYIPTPSIQCTVEMIYSMAEGGVGFNEG